MNEKKEDVVLDVNWVIGTIIDTRSGDSAKVKDA